MNDAAPGDGGRGYHSAAFLELRLAQQSHEVQPVDVESAIERHPLQIDVGHQPRGSREIHPQGGLPRVKFGGLAKVIGGVARVLVGECAIAPGVERDRVVGVDLQGLVEQPQFLAELPALTRARGGGEPRLDFSCHIRHAAR